MSSGETVQNCEVGWTISMLYHGTPDCMTENYTIGTCGQLVLTSNRNVRRRAQWMTLACDIAVTVPPCRYRLILTGLLSANVPLNNVWKCCVGYTCLHRAGRAHADWPRVASRSTSAHSRRAAHHHSRGCCHCNKVNEFHCRATTAFKHLRNELRPAYGNYYRPKMTSVGKSTASSTAKNKMNKWRCTAVKLLDHWVWYFNGWKRLKGLDNNYSHYEFIL